jgi:hypothetical protein
VFAWPVALDAKVHYFLCLGGFVFLKMRLVLFCLFTILSFSLIHAPTSLAAKGDPLDPAAQSLPDGSDLDVDYGSNQDLHMFVVLDPRFVQNLETSMDRDFDTGTRDILATIEKMAKNSVQLQQLNLLAESGIVISVTKRIHPNQEYAVKWINEKFADYGLPNVKFNPHFDSNLPDPTQLDPEKTKTTGRLRMFAGPGVAVAAGFVNAYHKVTSAGASGHDFITLLIPTVSMAVMAVTLEIQFAHKKINPFWRKFWSSGPLVGRMKNLMVNVLYGEFLYAAEAGSAQIPKLWGSTAIPFNVPEVPLFISNYLHHLMPAFAFTNHHLAAATVVALVSGLWYTLNFGQYQPDMGIEVKRGSLSAEEAYKLETTGVLYNNSIRIASWVNPGDWPYYAMAVFGSLRTLPQLLLTNVNDHLDKYEMHAKINPATAPMPGFITSCALAIRKNVALINLPHMTK